MKRTYNDEKIIKIMKKLVGFEGIITRDDDGYPITYESKLNNDTVYVFDDNMNYIKIQ